MNTERPGNHPDSDRMIVSLGPSFNPVRLTLGVLIGSVLGLVVLYGAVRYSVYRHHTRVERVRPPALRETMQRARPIIGAIHAYTKKHGRPPDQLDALVPTYLRRLPDTGRLASNGWEYTTDGRREAGAWSLFVEVRDEFSPNVRGFGDRFVFHPSGKYAHSDYGGILERFGRWGYYVE
jgi:hypothetical protein